MRIAILGSVALPVPPPAQGGTEWVAHFQAEGLAKRGHKVLLFAAKGSKQGNFGLIEVGGGDTVAGSRNQLPGAPLGSENIESSRMLRKENVYLSQVMQILMDRKDEYDVILNNMRGEAVFLPLAKSLGKPFVNVMHLPLFDELVALFKTYNTSVISISNNQRKPFPDVNYAGTVYNCVDTSIYTFNPNPKDYLLMMGTIGRHKNQAGAIRVAKRLGMKLVIAGKVRDKDYFEELKKDIDDKNIVYKGELSFEEKLALYQNAQAFIFPILWEEPFGLVMIEAMACGTPVVAFKNGAISEVVLTGMTGYVIENNSEEGMCEAIKKIHLIKREDCRNHVEQNFSVDKMVEGYENVLLSLVS